MRQKIAEHMVSSRRTSAHVSTIHEADMTGVVEIRAELKDRFADRGVKLTFLPFVIQAIARGLRRFPALNASIEPSDEPNGAARVRYHSGIHIGVAVALEEGLIVPVLRDADRLSVLEIARATNDLAARARNKTLGPSEVRDGTFTITNPGVFGTLIGTPIIAQPQVAILCLGAIQKRPVVLADRDAIAIRSMAYLSLTFDHRLIDGAVADQFLAAARSTIENREFQID